MKKDIKHFIDIFREKLDLVENSSDERAVEELLEECTCLSDIIEHIMREKKVHGADASAFSAQRRRLRHCQRSRKGKRAYSRLIETRPLLESAALLKGAGTRSGQALLEFHKKLALENIRSKGETVDNIAHKIKLDEELCKGTLVHLDSAFRHQRGRNRIYNVLLAGVFFLILMALTFRVITRV
ncbi:UNVERIFIED_CONTAM: hypothetical protein PYX00_011395 [Menopon gallinae]|uniref:Uncharacterized protein n=1 Tax=Menopon gallinae TaxID=328185 RepID=A0AAW2H7G0_9NEOP